MEDIIRDLEKTTFFSKTPIDDITLYFFYINNDVVEAVEKESITGTSKLSADLIQEQFTKHKIFNNKAYTLNGLHKYNFEQDSVINILNTDNITDDFIQYKKIEPIYFSDAIYHYADYASLFFILENKKSKRNTKTKKDISTPCNKTKKSHS
jgi:hypothetical protein